MSINPSKREEHDGTAKKTKSIRLLNFIEEKGNKLPDPVTIFIIFTLLVIGISHVLYVMGTSVSFEGVNNDIGSD